MGGLYVLMPVLVDVYRWNTCIWGVLSVTGTNFLGSRVFFAIMRLSHCART